MMDVLHDLHADFAQAVREAEGAVSKLKATWQALIEHLGVDAAPIVEQAKTDAEQLAASGAGAVESAVAQTVAPTADVTTPPTTQA